MRDQGLVEVIPPRDALACPRPGARRERASSMLHGIAGWITRDPLRELLGMFDHHAPDDWDAWPPTEVLDHLASVEPWQHSGSLWDYRGLAARAGRHADDGGSGAGAARLHDHPTGLGLEGERRVLALADELGLRAAGDASQGEYDLVVALGGLRLSPKLRAEWAVRQLRDRGVRTDTIALLGTSRPIQPEERAATDTYAPGARTEFDLLVSGAIEAGLISRVQTPAITRPRPRPKPQLADCWIHGYPGRLGAHDLYVVSAPAPAPHLRRPSTAETLEFMIGRPEFRGAQRILLVTSAICAPYQQVEAMRAIALPHNAVVEVIGLPVERTEHLRGAHTARNYLQEIRSVIQAALRLHAQCDGPGTGSNLAPAWPA
jgi:hypothetical protein